MLKKRIFFSCFVIAVLYFITKCEAKYECRPGVYQCHLDNWTAWSKCTAQCGGGISYMYKPLCCSTSYNDTASCAKDCNITTAQYYKTRPCGQICSHGQFNGTKCECPSGYHGKCCENVGTSTVSRTTVSVTTVGTSTVSTKSKSLSAVGTSTVSTKSKSLSADLKVLTGDDGVNCFQDKGVTTVMILMMILVAGGITVDAILGYWIYKLKKKMGCTSGGFLPGGGGVAPAATKIK